MNYFSVAEMAKKWNMSERTVRNYCANDKISGAFLTGKTWNIPENAEKPERINKKNERCQNLLERLRAEKNSSLKGGIYHKIQIELTYNSNHIEGSKLTHDQTRYIFETNTIGVENDALNVDDIIETANHFRAIDYIIDCAEEPLTEDVIKELKGSIFQNPLTWDEVYYKGWETKEEYLAFLDSLNNSGDRISYNEDGTANVKID